MANNDEAVDFEPDMDDLMDEDAVAEAEAPSPAAPAPKLRSTITGGEFSGVKKTKGRGFRESEAEAERNSRFAGRDFDSLDSAGGPGPQRCHHADTDQEALGGGIDVE
ncbi:hypothetical protein QJS10_CPB17g01748 [Acorus calamus]|uniref:Uncharacterized protein n=1 Tax=Acorus calamus TaxID=4465 RepID=A0AAV9CZJ5_ACOCL|nr:hypothetical protein QJS10_CPB17g01748 [Acorus calamus]